MVDRREEELPIPINEQIPFVESEMLQVQICNIERYHTYIFHKRYSTSLLQKYTSNVTKILCLMLLRFLREIKIFFVAISKD